MFKYFLTQFSKYERIAWAIVLLLLAALVVYTFFYAKLSPSEPSSNKTTFVAPSFDNTPTTMGSFIAESSKIKNVLKLEKEKLSLKEVLGLEKDFTKLPVYFPVRQLGFKRVSSMYGERVHPTLKRRKFHSGVDLAAKRGTPIYSAADGKVVLAGRSPTYGIYVVIQHPNAYATMYGHMQKKVVKEGIIVKQGEVIGHVGSTGRSTGPHLHFEVFKNGKNIDPYKFWMNSMDDYLK